MLRANPYPGSLADEDIDILVAIAEKLEHEGGLETIELPHGFQLTRGGMNVSFSGIDAIERAKHEMKMASGLLEPYVLIMPSSKTTPQKIGSLFGMDCWVDPHCPKDQFYLKVATDYPQKST